MLSICLYCFPYVIAKTHSEGIKMAAALFLMMRKNVLFSFQVNGNETDFLGNFRSTVLLVSSAPSFVSLPCITPSSAAVETLRPAQNILRNTALLRFPRKSNVFACQTDDRRKDGFQRYVFQKREVQISVSKTDHFAMLLISSK